MLSPFIFIKGERTKRGATESNRRHRSMKKEKKWKSKEKIKQRKKKKKTQYYLSLPHPPPTTHYIIRLYLHLREKNKAREGNRKKERDGSRKRNEVCGGEAEGVAGVTRELWWVFGRWGGQGVSTRLQGRKAASLDTSRGTFSHTGFSPCRLLLLLLWLLPWEEGG